MTNLHPIFQKALAPFRPPVYRLTHYVGDNIVLECELDYEKAEGDGWNEPKLSARAYLLEANHKGVDITELIGDELREQIETAFLEQY